jgi:hypothetical protein
MMIKQIGGLALTLLKKSFTSLIRFVGSMPNLATKPCKRSIGEITRSLLINLPSRFRPPFNAHAHRETHRSARRPAAALHERTERGTPSGLKGQPRQFASPEITRGRRPHSHPTETCRRSRFL